jgi:cell pole-organizing protein PopZ
MGQSSEPTVEEILQSIKQVIARDNRAGAAELRRERETRGMPDDDVLDLASSATFLDDLDTPEADDDDAPLIAETTQAGMRESLAALAMLSQPGAQPQIVRSGETSIESLVRELLRPALAEWLEKNLPPLVERMVADEIRRISSKKG